MGPETVMTIAREAIEVSVMLMAPMLLTALAVGLIVGIFQAATQINEATLSFVPKIIGIMVAFLLTGPWMLGIILDYMRVVFTNIANVTH
ncbi:MAG: flagellar biosynthesis protein FliQ [Proteobacteria bacterium]|nr:flagellar biosynthesis protein FliQ [Pseudomonadota bacterium]